MKEKEKKQNSDSLAHSLESLILDLGSEDSFLRQRARRELVQMGPAVVDYLSEIILFPEYVKHAYRWEALKTLVEMRNPAAIPVFIAALEDKDSDIRWLAAEGLIKLKRLSFSPLLEALEKRPESAFLRLGAHHVLSDLKKEFPARDKLDQFLYMLKKNDRESNISVLANQLRNLIAN